MKDTILRGKSLTKNFGGTSVLQGIDVDIYAGDFTVIMGSSGTGKSTLLYGLSGMDSLSGGEVFFRNQPITGLSEKKMAELRAKEFGFVFQQTHLVSNLTLFENVAVAGYAGKSADVNTRTHALLEQMHVGDAESRLPNQVSGGEAQRVGIVRALINSPQILFADEPTGALNSKTGLDVLDTLTHFHEQGQSVVMVTHDMRSARRGNRILYLKDGSVLGECDLGKYRHGDLERHQKLSAFLTQMGW